MRELLSGLRGWGGSCGHGSRVAKVKFSVKRVRHKEKKKAVENFGRGSRNGRRVMSWSECPRQAARGFLRD